MVNFIKKIIFKIMYGPRSDSDSFIKYLRKRGCKIGESCFFYSPRTMSIDSVRTDWISIGKYTKITSGVTILAHDYSSSVLVGTHNEILLAGGSHATIGENCFIGMNAVIMPGRHVGNNCIIGTGAVVTIDVPDNMVVAGNPAKVIMTVDEFYQKRKNRYLNDAKRNVLHFYEQNGRYPKTQELYGFALLYLERTEKNFNKYFSNYLSNDNNKNDNKKCFFNTKPIFDSYDDFIDFCKD